MIKTDREMLYRAVKDGKLSELFICCMWLLFNRKKFNKLIKCINCGITWKTSFLIAKNLNK